MKRALLEMMGVEDGEREVEPELDEAKDVRWGIDRKHSDGSVLYVYIFDYDKAPKFDAKTGRAAEREVKAILTRAGVKNVESKYHSGANNLHWGGNVDHSSAEKALSKLTDAGFWGWDALWSPPGTSQPGYMNPYLGGILDGKF